VDWDVAVAFLKALREERVRYVLVGGVAMILYGRARATRDIDVFVEPTAENVERLRRALRRVTQDPCVDEIRAEDLAGDYPAIQYISPDGTLKIDIVARLGEAFRFADLEATDEDIGETTVSVATPATLHAMKKGTVRDVDRLDAAWLRDELGVKDEER
jgi:hypothetical protein